MEKAENYADFTKKLCDKVCAEPTSPLLQFFAYYYSWLLDEHGLHEQLANAGKVPDLAEPLHLTCTAGLGEAVHWEDMKKALKRALNAAPNDWVATLLYLAWRLPAESLYPESDVDIRPIELIETGIHENQELSNFGSDLYLLKGSRLLRERNLKKASKAFSQAIAIARKFDDPIRVANILTYEANSVKHTDVKKALDLLATSRELCRQPGYRQGLGMVLLEMGHIMAFRGELDAAIDYHLEFGSIQEVLSLQSSGVHSTIAAHYNTMGDGKKALEYAGTASGQRIPHRRSTAQLHTQLAWALTNLGRTDEARDELEKSGKLATKSGDSRLLTYSRIVEGILDKAENNYDSAVQNFEEVLRSLEDDPVPLWQNLCLLNLVEIEIERLSPESIDVNADSSGPWMKRLDEHTEKNDLPGIAARSLILKASLRKKQGRHDEVRSLLKEVLRTAESPSMRYLNDFVLSAFPDVILS
jgi:tetratricopeptide (TPR) repeat protein